MDPAPKRAKLETIKLPAEEVIKFQLMPPGKSTQEALIFAPEMSHQLFGDDENIEGHEDAAATVWISHTNFEYLIDFSSKSKQQGATKVKEILEGNFKVGLHADKASFLDSHSAAARLDPAALGSAVLQGAAGDSTKIHHFHLSQAPDTVKEIHKRAQQLLLFFVDGAQPIDQGDPEWDLFVAVQHQGSAQVMVGFCTVYRVYAYPASSRLRVSQIFVLPPFQRQGIGQLLLEAVYNLADAESLQNIIFEEPTDTVQAMRESIELKRAERLPWLLEHASQQGAVSVAMNGSAGSQPPSTLALPADQIARAQKELRATKQQVRRIWELLLVKQPSFQKEPGLFALRGLVARRLFGSFADTKKQAVGKQIFTFDEVGSFCMRKVPTEKGLVGVPVALEDTHDKGQSKEERLEALEQAVEDRMQFLSSHVGLLV